MGYYISQEETKINIPKESFSRCLDAIKGLVSKTDRWFSWVTSDQVLSSQTLQDALESWRWIPTLDSNGDIFHLSFRGQKSGSDIELFTAIAPFVKCGSYIQMRGEEGEIWRWVFSGGKVQEKYAKIVWD